MSTTTDQRDALAKALKESIELHETRRKFDLRDDDPPGFLLEIIDKFIQEWKIT